MKKGPFPAVQVTWRDSALINEQSDNLPTVNTVISVGWLAEEDDDHIVVVRDYHTNPDSYRWRGACAIPKFAITSMVRLELKKGALDAGQGADGSPRRGVPAP